MPSIEPGTYKIVNVHSSTCIVNYPDRPWEAVCWRRLDGLKNHQWYVQRSGEGYHIQNCLNGMYLTVTETSDTKPPAKIFCGRYPTTWELNQGNEDHEIYVIKQAGADRVLDLGGAGAAHDGNQIYTYPQRNWCAWRRWRFERLRSVVLNYAAVTLKFLYSDDTGEREQKLFKEIQANNKRIEKHAQQIKEQNARLAEKDSLITELKAQLESRDNELDKVKFELDQKSTLAAQLQDALRQASESLATQGRDLLRARFRVCTVVWKASSPNGAR
ncbi:hypothetical protein FRC12_001784 [Ceratobasidium sp. 428]|nr:hypothetical protein FRC12_001784 [Ceratobasidium sp. 428]